MDAYPHLNINVKDTSIYVPIKSETLPLHRPIYVMKTEKGPINTPVWCGTFDTAKEIFGASTFDRLNKEYFSRSSVFLMNSFQNNGAFIVRVGNESLIKSSFVIEVNISGAAADGDNDYVYTVRELDTDTETISNIAATATKFPIVAFQMPDAGKYGNEYGFVLFIDSDKSSYNEINRIGSFIYNLGFVKKDSSTSTFDRVKTKFTPYDFSFSPTENAIDPDTKLVIDFENQFARYFDNSYVSPINVHFYNNNILTLTTAVMNKYYEHSAVEVQTILKGADGTESHPNKIDILTLKVRNALGAMVELGMDEVTGEGGTPERRPVIVNTDEISFNKNTPNYMVGGDDGDTDISGVALDNNATIEGMIEDFYDLTANATIVDKAKYPFNTIIDTGYSVALKNVIAGFLSYRDDVKVVMSTWAGTPQDEATAIGVASSLITNIRLTPESELFGTGCFRGMVFGQTGILNGELYKKEVPLTIWYATKMAEYHNLTYINRNPSGLPNSEVAMFKSINWIPSDKVTKRSLWDGCINYCQYYNMTNLHFPGLKSVYQYDTSVLSTDSFTNAIVYIKQAVLPIWAKYAGVEDVDLDATYASVVYDINNKLSQMLNGLYTFNVTMYQTEEEAKMGYIHHVNIEITGGPSQRVWNVDIICKRTNFEG